MERKKTISINKDSYLLLKLKEEELNKIKNNALHIKSKLPGGDYSIIYSNYSALRKMPKDINIEQLNFAEINRLKEKLKAISDECHTALSNNRIHRSRIERFKQFLFWTRIALAIMVLLFSLAIIYLR